MWRVAGTWRRRAGNATVARGTSGREGATRTVQAKGETAAEGGDCGVVREKRYAVAAKWRLDRLRKMKTPSGSPLNAQLRGEQTKEPLAVGSS